MKKSKIYLIVGVVLLIVISPVLLTLPTFDELFDFSDTGQIGDTIGGITAPFINLLGAILVYLSFSEQQKANKIQQEALLEEIRSNSNERTYDSIVHDIDNLRADINDFKFLNDKNIVGVYALYKFASLIQNLNEEEKLVETSKKPLFGSFYFLFVSTDDILIRINKSDLNESDKQSLHKKLLFLYTSKIFIHSEVIIEKYQKYGIKDNLIVVLIEMRKNINSFIEKSKI